MKHCMRRYVFLSRGRKWIPLNTSKISPCGSFNVSKNCKKEFWKNIRGKEGIILRRRRRRRINIGSEYSHVWKI